MDNDGQDVLSQTAGALGSKSDQPNIALAERLVRQQNVQGVSQLVAGLEGKQSLAGDCIKVLYETGCRDPHLIAPYTDRLITLLQSKNNRLVWGAMTALGYIAPWNPGPIYARLDIVLMAYENGSVITVDNAISVLAELCKADAAYEKRIAPLLLRHLQRCSAKQIPQHLERIAICLNPGNRCSFTEAVKRRLEELSPAQKTRVERLLRKIG